MRPSRILDPSLECEAPGRRDERLFGRLRDLLTQAAGAGRSARAVASIAGIGSHDVRTWSDLARLPILRKDDLAAIQAADPPFGGLNGVAPSALARIFASPGPIYDPQGTDGDFWRFREALAAAGFRCGDIVHNTFSYHLTPAGFMFDGALRQLGCTVIPAGTGQTDLQVRVAADLRATGYVGTPSFLHTLLTRSRELGRPLGFEVAFVSAERLPESLRTELETDHGLRVLQGYGTADLGMIAYECPEKNGMHLHPDAIVELLDRETGGPAAPGEPGEVVVTVFEPSYPLLRFATGDIAAMAPAGACPCGRTAPRIAGIVGRVGDAVKVKGMFVRASQIDEVARTVPEIARWRAVVTRESHQDRLVYEIEPSAGATIPESLTEHLAERLRDHVKVRGEVVVVPAGTLPEGARKIDDRRVWN